MLTRDEEPIIALCTAQGKGAIALLRITGVNTSGVVLKMSKLASKKDITQVASHTINYGWVTDGASNNIDQVMFLVMHGPKTFTGQDTIEITCHNNPFLIEAIIAQAIKHGARMAEPGEFTRRAFINGKIDLLQAEAINELIHANTQLTLKKSLAQLEGSFSHWILNIETELIRTLAWCEASFEFLDEELEFGSEIQAHLKLIINNITDLKKTYSIEQQIRQGIKIALIGSVNAGKSSIFNALLNQNRSIVTDIAGTTRDVIEAGLYRNGNYWTLVDTAGLRQTHDVIEQEGIKRSFSEAKKADIIILVFDGSRALTHEEQVIYDKILAEFSHKIILVHNKSDLPDSSNNNLIKKADIKLSGATKDKIDILESSIEQKIALLFEAIESPFLLNQRQFNLILGLEEKLNNIINMFNEHLNYELISYNLRDSLEHLCELTGKSVSEAGMDMVFKEFCVGK